MDRPIDFTEDAFLGWIEHGLMMDAKYMCIVLDDFEARPFFIFREQSVISQVYNVHKFYGDKSLLCVIRLDEHCFDDIPTTLVAVNNFSLSVEN